MSEVERILMSVEDSAVEAARPDPSDVWPTHIVGIGELEDIRWYALTVSGIKSPEYKTHAEAVAWAVEYNKAHEVKYYE